MGIDNVRHGLRLCSREVVQDLAYAARLWLHAPGFTLAATLVLGLGIGAATTIFSVVDGVLLRPLPYQHPDRLVAVWARNTREQGPSKLFDSYADFDEYRRRARSFDSIAAATWAVDSQVLTGHGPTREVTVVPVSASFFSTLGVSAALGRTFVADDESRGCSVVIGNALWQNALQSDRTIVGGSIRLDNRACVVVGVMPPGFAFYPQAAQAWALLDRNFRPPRAQLGVGIFARLAPGVTRAQAQSELIALHDGLHPAEGLERDLSPRVYELQGEFTWLASRTLRSTLFAVSGAVGLVLVIACLNIATLLLGRSVARDRELAIRAAVGASRPRLLRQLLTEGLLLSALGGGAGIAIAFGVIRYLRSATPIELPVGAEVSVSVPVLLFAAGVSVVTTIIFALLPALRASGVGIGPGLKTFGYASGQNRAGRRLVSALVALETALSIALLVGAGLLIQSVLRMANEPLGFNPDGLVTTTVSLPEQPYVDAARQQQFFNELERRLSSMPGVSGVAFGSPRAVTTTMEIEGQPSTPPRLAARQTLSPSSLAVLQVPLLRGRAFGASDDANAEPVAIVNESLVREYFAGADPIGRHVRLGERQNRTPWLRIVGISRDLKGQSLYEEMSWTTSPAVFRPFRQDLGRRAMVTLRIARDTAGLGDALQRELASLDADIPLGEVQTMRARLSRGLSYPRFRAVLSGGFAGSALLLAIVGLYGVLGQFVAQRAREFAVRMAIGASRGHVFLLVTRHGGLPVAAGLVAGLGGSLALARLLANLLYGVGPADPGTLAGMSMVLLVAAGIAMAFPAHRAARVDPMVALRDE